MATLEKPHYMPPQVLVTKSGISTVDRFGVLYCAAALMEYVPTVSIRTLVFLLVAIWVSFDVFNKNRLYFLRKSILPDMALFTFVMMVLLSIFWGSFFQVQIEDWFRGMVPFLFLGMYFTVDKREPDIAERLIRWMYIAAWIWIVRIFIEFGLLVFGGLTISGRLTSVIFDSVIPYGLITVPFLITMFNGSKALAPVALLGFFLTITLLTGYRSQTSIIVMQLFLLAIIWSVSVKKTVTLMFALLIAVVGLSAVLDVATIIETIRTRFENTDATFESSRLAEWAFAVDQFWNSPLFGKGIGFQVPAEVTFRGADLAALSAWMVIPESAGYVHSVTGYVMFTLGGLGALSYYTMTLSPTLCLISPKKWRNKHRKRLAITAVLALISLLIYFQVQAAFRMVQMNLAIVALLLILGDLKSKRSMP